VSDGVAIAGPSPRLLWEAAGFAAPESVVFDRERQQLYVSNMGTWGEGATPGDGFISRVSAGGRILDLRWLTGFENPKGLAFANHRLYVADDADLTVVDPATGAVTARYAPAGGPGGFNDCTADPSGNVYVFSRRLSSVFRLHAGKLERWFAVDMTKAGSPNGLLAERHRLLLGGWLMQDAGGREVRGLGRWRCCHRQAQTLLTALVRTSPKRPRGGFAETAVVPARFSLAWGRIPAEPTRTWRALPQACTPETS
jgi:hypothetical protein